jgi:hypothetical protein
MSRLLCSALLALTVASTAGAGTVYRIVNADGSVTFSDTPPANAGGGAYAIVGSGGAGAPSAREAGNSVSRDLQQTKPATVRSERAASSPANAASSAQPRPSAALESAVIGVLGMDDVVARTEKICVETLPTSFARYSDAAQGWRTRNGQTVALAKQRLANDFDAPARALITAGIPLKNDAMFSPVAAAPMASRIQWCDQSFATIDGGTMDVVNNAKLAGPLAAAN